MRKEKSAQRSAITIGYFAFRHFYAIVFLFSILFLQFFYFLFSVFILFIFYFFWLILRVLDIFRFFANLVFCYLCTCMSWHGSYGEYLWKMPKYMQHFCTIKTSTIVLYKSICIHKCKCICANRLIGIPLSCHFLITCLFSAFVFVFVIKAKKSSAKGSWQSTTLSRLFKFQID